MRYGSLPVEELVVGSGIDDLMGLVVRAFVAPGGAALTTRGSYPTFNYHVVGYGGRLVYAPYRDDGRLDLGRLVDVAHREKPSVIYLANPDNPSGRSFARRDGEFFAMRFRAHAVVLLDEAYADFVERFGTASATIEDRLIRTRTFSKAYGMAGARIGYAFATERNIATFQKIRLQYGVNRNAQIGALASL